MNVLILAFLLLLSGCEPVVVDVEICCAIVLGILLAYGLLIVVGRAR